MNYLITGASGFVGGAIAEKLKNQHQIFAMARSDESAEKVISLGCIPIRTELNKVTLENLNGIDLIIHSAAFVGVWGRKKQFWDANVKGTQQLLEVAKQAGIKRFIHIGTEACLFYGQSMDDVDETYPYALNSPYYYSQTKAEAEKSVLEANVPGSFETVSIRPRMVWGPKDQTILPELIKMVDRGMFIWINNGKYKTSVTHIDNFVHGVELAIEKGRGGEAYFITDEGFTTIKEFITQLLDTQNMTPTSKSISPSIIRPLAKVIEKTWRLIGIKKEPPITRLAIDFMSFNCTINIDKAKKELGYQPVIDMKTGMQQMKKETTT